MPSWKELVLVRDHPMRRVFIEKVVVNIGVGASGEKLERAAALLKEVRRVFSGLPVYVGVEDGYVYVKRTAPMDKRQFKKYVETCRRLGFRFDRRG